MAKALVLGGATGLLGQALTRTLAGRGWEVATLGRNDGNLLEPGFLQAALDASHPDVIFNAVAWTAVDDAEDHPDEAGLLNRALPDSLARAVAARTGFLMHFSTDFVFGEGGDTPRREEDEPQPTSIYARTKLEGEQAVTAALPDRSCIVRTAWLFGPGRKNFVDTIIAACRRRDAIRVVHDQVGSPTCTLDLAQWCAVLAEKRAAGVWHAVNSGQASWCELACEAVALAGASCRVEPIESSEWPQKARRPAFSVLANSKLAALLGKPPRPWPQALREYIFSSYVPAGRTEGTC
ncbi:MAG: dTDP-4-dehydrorhamnose reductase [Desulfovibrio desulfuricans]|jgi:dTDP-4-dehydrorhamnose reductase|nr:dTDP-4-dehydrorhamnose reductase [Desulfovibrio desulfuricans]